MGVGGHIAGVRRSAWGLVLAVALVARAQETPPAHVILYGNDMLTVHVAKVPVSEILAELSRQSGADIRGTPREPREVSVQFDAVPLPQALSRLLGGQNYALIYGRGGRLRAVKLLGGSPGRPLVAAAPPAPPVVPPRGARDLTPILDRQVRVAGPVADALESPMVSLRQLGDLWLHGDDDALRGESVLSGFRAVEAETELRSALVDYAQSYTDAELAQVLRGIAGSRAAELAAFVVGQTRVTELHMKAASVLRLLEAGG